MFSKKLNIITPTVNILFYETKMSMPPKGERMSDAAFKLRVVKWATESNKCNAARVHGVNVKQVT